MNKTDFIWMSKNPCYIDNNDVNNPYRLTLYLDKNGIFSLKAEGNGCGDDLILDAIGDWISNEEVIEKYGKFDLAQIRKDSNSLRKAGRNEDADWLSEWADKVQEIIAKKEQP